MGVAQSFLRRKPGLDERTLYSRKLLDEAACVSKQTPLAAKEDSVRQVDSPSLVREQPDCLAGKSLPAPMIFLREHLPCAKSYRQTPEAGRRVKVEIQGRRGNSTLTRRPATHNQDRIRARNFNGVLVAPII